MDKNQNKNQNIASQQSQKAADARLNEPHHESKNQQRNKEECPPGKTCDETDRANKNQQQSSQRDNQQRENQQHLNRQGHPNPQHQNQDRQQQIGSQQPSGQQRYNVLGSDNKNANQQQQPSQMRNQDRDKDNKQQSNRPSFGGQHESFDRDI